MATTTHTYPASKVSAMEFLKNEKFCAEVTLDISKLYEGSVAGCSIGDVIQMINIPKGCLVTDVFVRVDASTAAAFGVDVGDGTDASGWRAVVSCKIANGTMKRSLEASNTLGKGKLYTAADTIDLSVKTSNATAGTLTVIAEGVVIEEYA